MKRYLWILSAVFAIAFAAIADVVVYAPALAGALDGAVHILVLPLQTPAWSEFFLVITNFGSTFGIIAGLLLVMYLYRHRPDIVVRLMIALLGATITGEYLKQFIQRARPITLPWLQPITSYSFPSGHSYSAMVLYGFLALLLFVHSRTRLRRFFSLLIPGLCILVIGLSRIALNYHYATDVLGGYVLGAFWITVSLAIPLYYEFYHQEVIHSEPIEKPLL